MSEVKINAKIFPLKISENKYVVGDVIIDTVNNLLSPFQQVDLFLNGIFEDARIMNSSNIIKEDGTPVMDKTTAELHKKRIYTNHAFKHKFKSTKNSQSITDKEINSITEEAGQPFKGAGKKRNRKTKKNSKK